MTYLGYVEYNERLLCLREKGRGIKENIQMWKLQSGELLRSMAVQLYISMHH